MRYNGFVILFYVPGWNTDSKLRQHLGNFVRKSASQQRMNIQSHFWYTLYQYTRFLYEHEAKNCPKFKNLLRTH